MMRLLLLSPLILGMIGCTNSGMGAINWSGPGKPDGQTCESTAGFWHQYCATGEHPNICECYQ